jgi:hypothetical protein
MSARATSEAESPSGMPHLKAGFEEVDTLSDLNVFSFWKEEILSLYTTGRSLPQDGIFRRALQRSNLVEQFKDQNIWSEYGLALIEKELHRRGLVVETHRSFHWKKKRS